MTMRKIFSLLFGYLDWKMIRIKYRIDSKSVVLFLPEIKPEWNQRALKYIPAYLYRKKADRAIVLVNRNAGLKDFVHADPKVITGQLYEKRIRHIMDYYTLFRFSDRVVFFYLEYPKDNCSRIILEQTKVSMDELICLGFYRLREVPDLV